MRRGRRSCAQISRDGNGNRLAPDDLVGQVAEVLRNTARGLAAAGATFGYVVRLRFSLTRSTPEMLGDFTAGIDLVAEEVGLPRPLPPVSVIGVDFLFEPDVLIELEAHAVLD